MDSLPTTPQWKSFNRVMVTGGSSGVGASLVRDLSTQGIEVLAPSRIRLNLDCWDTVCRYQFPDGVDCLINCAAHDLDGKQPFLDHPTDAVARVMTCNLLSPMMLCQKALRANPACKLVNITSTNNLRYWGNDLAYSLSKLALSRFGEMLLQDHPNVDLLEICLGLTRTSFNTNRYRRRPKEIVPDIYDQPCLEADEASQKILEAMADPQLKHVIIRA